MTARVIGRTRLTTFDALPIALAFAQGALLATWPSVPLVALGLWWNANTISHHFIHRPFFRSQAMNAGFSCYLTLVLGFPQTIWRARHLAHHIAVERRHGPRNLKLAPLDLGAAVTLWAALLVFAPEFVLTVYLPGFVLGLGLCYLQGKYEHARGTVSHYGWLYNLLLFNDGYHIEHHERPAANWRELPHYRVSSSNSSRWPAVLRWLEVVNLCALERAVLRFTTLQRFVLDRHERAVRKLLIELPAVRRAVIVGGGLFPRTALILRRVLPETHLVLIDQSDDHLAIARQFLSESSIYNTGKRRQPARDHVDETGGLRSQDFINARFEPETACDSDLLVIPLAFEGNRRALYERPCAPAILVHDWIWRRRGTSAIVSLLLLKRLNLVRR